MNVQRIAWSDSRVKTHETCPKKFYHMVVVPRGEPDRVDYKQGYSGKKGEDFHKAMENRLLHKTPLQPVYATYEAMAQVLEAAPGTMVVEYAMALDASFQPCGTKDWDRVWIRAVPDVMKVSDTAGFILDWKTGKPEFREYQLKLNAAVAFAHFPTVQSITVVYGYLKIGTLSTPVTYYRADLEQIWNELLAEPRRMHENLARGYWPAKPGHYCSWCEVNGAGKCDKAAKRYNP